MGKNCLKNTASAKQCQSGPEWFHALTLKVFSTLAGGWVKSNC